MIIKNRFLVLFVLLIAFMDKATAQQDAQYTQYMYNTFTVNPGYAGSRGQLSAAALYRTQWTGVVGAPETFTLNLHSPIRNSRLGYGISIVNDNIGDGVVQETSLDAAISYTIDVAQDAKLSFGLKAGANILNLDFNGLRGYSDEVVSVDNIENKFSPNFGVGVYFHTNSFYAGVSVPNVVEIEHFDNSQTDATNTIQFLSKERINFYFITGYVFDLNGNVKFKPALLSKMVGGAPLQLDFSGTFLFNEKFSIGAAYRWDAAISGLVGFQLTDQLMLGFAYDKETTELGGTQYNDGSFEFFIRWELVKSFKRLVSPRFF